MTVPTLPSVALAQRAERWFGHPGRVLDVLPLTAGLLQVELVVDHLRNRPWSPGQEVEFRVDARAFRHYTPAVVDPATGRLEIVFSLDADGPGTRWVQGLAAGDDVAMMGPGGGLRRRPRPQQLLLGDATTLGLFAALLRDRAASRYDGAVEVAAGDEDAAAALVPGLTVLTRQAEPGVALLDWLGEHPPHRPDEVAACLAGHVPTMQRLRGRLLALGLSRRAVSLKAHWSTGRQGL
ncbi:siderophore-interacting protein [uncultured Friedmanniella sp.]|uniref:siderophore-interacting protein n=1 Tax=uncultured Friedmanniella sp. TaxID=335381 RepID=UPI0035CC0D1F